MRADKPLKADRRVYPSAADLRPLLLQVIAHPKLSDEVSPRLGWERLFRHYKKFDFVSLVNVTHGDEYRELWMQYNKSSLS